MKAPLVITFCDSPQMSHRIGLNLFNGIESAAFHCFLQLREQGEVTWSKVRGVGRVWEGWKFVFQMYRAPAEPAFGCLEAAEADR
jgi:hypothetical protein